MCDKSNLSALENFLLLTDVPRLRKNLNLLIIDSEKFQEWPREAIEDYYFLYSFLEEVTAPVAEKAVVFIMPLLMALW